MDYKSFDLLKELYFVRTSGSKEELKAANILLNEALKLNADEAHLEEFDVDGYEIKEAKLEFPNTNINLECVGVGMSGSTTKDGVKGPFRYVTCLDDAKVQDLDGAICLVHSKLCNYKLYEYFTTHNVKGLILSTGSVYKENKDVDLDPYMYRERHYKNGKIPAVCIRMRDAEYLLRQMPKEASIVVIQDEFKVKSHNVVATINGSSKSNEIIAFSAHYDSVAYSKGIYDNATGSTSIMQLLSYYAKNKPQRTLKFVWCGSEECGLLGSKAYVSAHEQELNDYKLNINVDMIGVTIGYDIACVTGETSLVDFIKYEGMINGFGISARQGVYSSDSSAFADKGVPGISFARLAPQGGATIHSHDDIIDWLSEDNYYKTCNFMEKFSDTLVNSKVFPVSKNIPDNMKLELDYYMGRKERP